MDRFEKFVRDIKAYFKEDHTIQLHKPALFGNEQKYVSEAISNSEVVIGDYISKFEASIKKTTKSKHVICTSSGTGALHIALLLAGVNKNEEVLTQALSFVATSNAINYCGAHPVFVDVDLDTMGMSPSVLKEFLENNTFQKNNRCYNKETGNRIAACVPMHTFGFPLRIDEIAALCNAYGIDLVEDAAQALGSTYKNKHVGTFGKLGILSFNGNKIITSGAGGCILTDDVRLAEKARVLINQSKEMVKPWETSHTAIGYNYRMPNINAALGLAQIEQLVEISTRKKELQKVYKNLFADFEGVQYVESIKEANPNNWLQTILFEDPIERANFLKFTNDNGIQTKAVWKPLNELIMHRASHQSSLKNTEYLSKRLVNLPSNRAF